MAKFITHLDEVFSRLKDALVKGNVTLAEIESQYELSPQAKAELDTVVNNKKFKF